MNPSQGRAFIKRRKENDTQNINFKNKNSNINTVLKKGNDVELPLPDSNLLESCRL